MRHIPPRTRQRIVAAWHGPLARDNVASQFSIDPATVGRIWARAKEAGILPESPRPHFAQHCRAAARGPVRAAPRGARQQIADLSAIAIGTGDADDAFSLDRARVIRVPKDDPLLARLRRHHADRIGDSRRDAIKRCDRDGSHDARAVRAAARARDLFETMRARSAGKAAA